MARKSRKETAAVAVQEADAACRAAIYVRLSVEDTHTHSVSIETQQMIIARYLEQYPEISVYDTYIDNGATGTNFHRPGFQQMLSDIVNRIADAQKIYQALPEDGAYCLTTHLCPAHRKARIKEIRERLKIGLPCRVVSTSLIEAGVDVDFPRVYREEAGLDSVLQAAGRCNREGKRPLDESLVTVFTVQNTTPPPYMRQPAAAMKNISKRMEDITSLAAIRAYFEFYRDLYGKEDLDREKILIAFENEMLPFASVAEKVRVIESCTTPVYIPIDQGEALVERLYRGERSRTLFRKLGQYSVNVYPQQLAALREAGAVQSIDGGALYVLADPRRYDSALGLTLDQTETALFI